MYNGGYIPIAGYDDQYAINKLGQVISLYQRNFGKFISQRIDRAGYYTVRLSKNGEVKTFLVHRLVAMTFIENPEDKKEVNHKNCNKLDNTCQNLEWVTHSENIRHAHSTGAIKCRKGKDHPNSVPLLFKSTGQQFFTIKEAAKHAGKDYETFRRNLRTNKPRDTYFEIK